MIEFTRGNLLEAKVDALVNTVNTVGVMGKGVALMFKEAFPQNFKAYEAACKKREVKVGRMFVTATNALIGPKWIVNFPTKEHWRAGSKMEWIESGLADLKRVIVEKKILVYCDTSTRKWQWGPGLESGSTEDRSCTCVAKRRGRNGIRAYRSISKRRKAIGCRGANPSTSSNCGIGASILGLGD